MDEKSLGIEHLIKSKYFFISLIGSILINLSDEDKKKFVIYIFETFNTYIPKSYTITDNFFSFCHDLEKIKWDPQKINFEILGDRLTKLLFIPKSNYITTVDEGRIYLDHLRSLDLSMKIITQFGLALAGLNIELANTKDPKFKIGDIVYFFEKDDGLVISKKNIARVKQIYLNDDMRYTYALENLNSCSTYLSMESGIMTIQEAKLKINEEFEKIIGDKNTNA